MALKEITRNLFATKNMQESVLIPSFAKLEEKIQNFPKKFGIITDFDFTLTKHTHIGYSISTINLIRVRTIKTLLSPEGLKHADELFKKYSPIELDFSMDKALRSKKMQEWWAQEYEIISNSNITSKDLVNIVQQSHIFLRDGVNEFFSLCDSRNIPVNVLSAGIGNFIDIILTKATGKPRFVISNFLQFDSADKVTGFSSPIIHSGNKVESVRKLPYEASLIIGDMPSDALAVPDATTNKILIGYLNTTQYKLEDFTSNFDIVIQNDGNFHIVNKLITYLTR